jgi:membrane protease YdiL (CAAX protease family)
MIPTFGVLVLAAALFVPLFASGGLGPLDFWWGMAASSGAVTAMALAVDRDYRRLLREDATRRPAAKIAGALVSALALYGVFAAGDVLSRRLLPFAADGIRSVYAFKEGVAPARVVVLIALCIGPAEEVFWRGFLQRRLAGRWGAWPGAFVATTLYAAVHLASGNAMLVIAAAVCGIFWGALYMRFRSVLLNSVSHVAWDLAVFVVWPLGG